MRKLYRLHRARIAPLAAVVMLVGGGTSPADAYLRPGVNELVSRSSAGSPGDGASGWRPTGSTGTAVALSPDGRFVAFESLANNLAPGDGNVVFPDIFVHDRKRATTELVSRGMHGLPPLFVSGAGIVPVGSVNPEISADGRYVAFISDATNLVPGDTNLVGDVFVHDRRHGTTERVSVSTSEAQANGTSMTSLNGAALSATGRFVAFNSHASNLVPGDTNGRCGFASAPPPANLILCSGAPGWDTFVRDRTTGKTTRVSVSSSEQEGDGDSEFPPSISADGRYVVFAGDSSNLAGTGPYPCSRHIQIAAPRRCSHVYVRDRNLGRTELVSVASDETPADNQSFLPSGQLMSGNGRYVLFHSFAENLIPNDGTGDLTVDSDLFVRDRSSGRTERVTVDSNGEQILAGCTDASISRDGRFVTYGCPYPGLPTDGVLFVHDRSTGATQTTSIAYGGTEARTGVDYRRPHIGNNGRYVAFSSNASSLVRNDDNKTFDVFVRDRAGDVQAGGLVPTSSSGYSASHRASAADSIVVSDPVHDGVASRVPDGELVAARLAYRPALADLFVRVDAARISGIRTAIAPSLAADRAVAYGISFTLGRVGFVARAAGDRRSELLRCTRAMVSCERIAPLEGGFGTVGEAVVWTIPAGLIGLEAGSRLRNVTAFSSLRIPGGSERVLLDEIRFPGR